MKLIKSFGYALKGLAYTLLNERNLRIHFSVAVVVIGAGFYFKIAVTEWLILLIMIALVISLELINTSIEKLADVVTREKNLSIGKVKDIAAAAVLFSAIVSVIVGAIIFSKYIFP